MLLVGNGRLFTRGASPKYFENGSVAIEGESIIAFGSTSELKAKYPQAEFIDAHGGLILPGYINAHSHIYSAFSRGLSIKGYNPKGFLGILDGLWWNIDRHLSVANSAASARAILLDCIKCGVTTFFDHHASFGEIEGSLFALADVAQEMGIRTALCYEVSDRDGEQKRDASIKENAAFIQHCLKDPSLPLRGMMGMHASFTISDQTMQKCIDATPEGIGYHIHVAEGIDDQLLCLKEHGKRVVNRLHDWGILGPNTVTGHCIHVSPAEMDLLAETDTIVIHNPESNMGNAVGCPPTLEMMAKGILCGLGTDGYTCDMLESLKVANIFHKHHRCDGTVGWAEPPQMLFENNAKITERIFGVKTGEIAEGASADVIVVDYDPITPIDETNLNSHLLFGVHGHDTVTTIARGKVLMQDREVKVCDPAEVAALARESSAELWKRINA